MHVKVTAPTNIAIVKYWGKNPKWEKYMLPTKSSVSFTVEGLFTQTFLDVKKGGGTVSFDLNGKKISSQMPEYEYVGAMLDKLFELVPRTKSYDYSIVTTNNFPTAAGFASSASGFAAFAKALQGAMKELEPGVYEKYFSDDSKLSVFARLGSGSAVRSIPHEGGFVIWNRGLDPQNSPDPTRLGAAQLEKLIFSSTAQSLFGPSHWKELRIIYCKTAQGEKKVKSRAGMKATVETNPLYWHWVEYEEQEVLPALIEAVRLKDFGSFGRICMECSNSLHAMMQYTTPRICYLNDTSNEIIDSVLGMNLDAGKTVAAYTFDAGPNAIVFTLEKHEKQVAQKLGKIVGTENLVATRPGPGPQVLKASE
ncbi:diphosphomevalonate decarboxylase [Candidatus Parvarchaeota archaeon]|nr:diphosphomevalonate decarboxylase [Candidatus Parvarchaeota archaeon]